MIKQVLNILGTEYTLCIASEQEEPALKEVDGFTDKTVKKIVVLNEGDDDRLSISDFAVYQRKIMRHEIIHAFLFESGLHENWEHRVGHDETYVDWIAVQFPKLARIFEDAGCTT